MYNVLLVSFFFIVVLLVFLIIVQTGQNSNFNHSINSVTAPKFICPNNTNKTIVRITIIVSILFFILTLTLSNIINNKLNESIILTETKYDKSITDDTK